MSHLFTIQQISQKCDVPKSTLRFWEKRLDPLFSPMRSPGGQRRYLKEHVELVCRIKQMQADGLSLNEMRQTLEQALPPDPELTVVVELDRLADRVAGLVKDEIYRFFREVPIANQYDHKAQSGNTIGAL